VKRRYDPVLVTGASGFIGGHIVNALIEQGRRVYAVYRRPTPPDHLKESETKGARLLRADLSKPGPELEEALALSEAVIHAAARTGDWGSMKKFMRSNYEPTLRLLDSARRAGCSKFVFVSSLAAAGFGEHVNSTEEGPHYELFNPYQKSKKMAEDAVRQADSPDMATTAVRPGNVYGPGDTTTFFPIFDAMERRLMGYLGKGDTLTCPVYIDDLAAGIILALDSDASHGEVFNLVGSDKATWQDILEYSAKELGIKPPRVKVPRWLALFLAAVLTGVFKAFFIPKAPPITFYRVHQLTNHYHFSNAKAKKVLGWEPKTRYRTGFKKTAADYLEEKRKTL
jgi:nucleoside-diphosphate-sugar epimerase